MILDGQPLPLVPASFISRKLREKGEIALADNFDDTRKMHVLTNHDLIRLNAIWARAHQRAFEYKPKPKPPGKPPGKELAVA